MRREHLGFISLLLTVWLPLPPMATSAAAEPADRGQVEFFEKQIRPLLAQHCFECHGPEKQESDLRLDSRTSILEGGLSGSAIVVGKPEKSLLIEAIGYEGDIEMPPDGPLQAADVAKLTKWVQTGAVWPGDTKSQPIRRKGLSDKDRSFWSFQPVNNPVLPKVKDPVWLKTPVDSFVLARLEKAGLSPAPSADRRKLIRRVTFDLTGLPPTPEEVKEFLSDERVDAYPRLIERLLASPAYGQRWGRHWLDLMRYCDSRDARHVGQPYDINEVWRYRDWVVRAMNEDMPYDRFVARQIAGDCLENNGPSGVNLDGLVASGMLVIGEWGSGDADAKKMLTDIVDDQINVVSQAFLGLSITCARCHDHKFDPISTADYYALAGIFFSTQIATPRTDAPLMRRPLASETEIQRLKKHQAQVTAQEQKIKQTTEQQVSMLRAGLVARTSDYLLAAWDYLHSPADSATVIEPFASERKLHPKILKQWAEYLTLTPGDGRLLTYVATNFDGKLGVFAWRGPGVQPLFLVNTNDKPVGVPGMMPPHSVAVHPGPTSGLAIGWKSPITGVVRITGRVADAHSGCGDGVSWSIDRRRQQTVVRLAAGSIEASGSEPLEGGGNAARLNSIAVKKGDLIRLEILPKNHHNCDLTTIEWVVAEAGGSGRTWNLAQDVVADLHENGKGNPHSDSHGNPDTWHFLDLLPTVSDKSKAAALASQVALSEWFEAAEASGADQASREVLQAAGRRIQQLLDKSALSKPRLKSPDSDFGLLYQYLVSSEGPFRSAQGDAEAMLPVAAQAQLQAMKTELDSLKKNSPPPIPVALSAQEGGVPGTPHAGFKDARIHLRGQYNRLGAVVPRGFPKVLAGDKQPPITTGSGRRELAEWIASENNPLTARVMVNRIWLHHFGEGIVRTPGDFGIQGERPTHPALLDYLAYQFVESGWSIKAMHRVIMLSATYRQSTQGAIATLRADPGNHLLGRMNVRRLESEAIRDTLLSVSGRLDRSMGGPSATRYPGGYSRGTVNKADYSSPRRALYVMTIRAEKTGGPFVLDAADPDRIVHRRMVSTTAPQALFVMNNPFVLSLVPRLSEQILATSDNDPQRIEYAYELLYGRGPSGEETAVGLAFLKTAFLKTAFLNAKRPADAAAAMRRAWEEYCHVLLCANELIYVD